MRARYKIPLIAGAVAMTGVAAITIGPVLLMIGTTTVAGIVMSVTPDEAFEEDFARIPEVGLFIEKYPDYATAHYGEFLGWKVINYYAKVGDEKSIELYVKKSVLHQEVRVSAGCFGSEFTRTFDITHEQVLGFLQDDRCSGEPK